MDIGQTVCYAIFITLFCIHSQKRASCSKSAADLLQVAIIKPISGCVRIACSGLMTTSLLQVVNRLAASCELQTCCKLRTEDLVQIVNCRLAANCELQACCKLRTADLQQVLNCRLAASCQLHIKQNHLKTQEINTLFYFISLIKLLRHLSFIM